MATKPSPSSTSPSEVVATLEGPADDGRQFRRRQGVRDRLDQRLRIYLRHATLRPAGHIKIGQDLFIQTRRPTRRIGRSISPALPIIRHIFWTATEQVEEFPMLDFILGAPYHGQQGQLLPLLAQLVSSSVLICPARWRWRSLSARIPRSAPSTEIAGTQATNHALYRSPAARSDLIGHRERSTGQANVHDFLVGARNPISSGRSAHQTFTVTARAG